MSALDLLSLAASAASLAVAAAVAGWWGLRGRRLARRSALHDAVRAAAAQASGPDSPGDLVARVEVDALAFDALRELFAPGELRALADLVADAALLDEGGRS